MKPDPTTIEISAARTSTTDPTFPSLSPAAGSAARPVAFMYDDIARPGRARTHLAEGGVS